MGFTTLIVAGEKDESRLSSVRNICQSLASAIGQRVEIVPVNEDGARQLREAIVAASAGVEVIEPKPPLSAAPMTAAPMVYREDGKPDWGSMWQTFCELALYGGPPHRGPDDPVFAPEQAGPRGDDAAIAEIKRGIWETTGLYSEAATPGWLAVVCHSRRMAAWMCAAIILENVDARCEEETLFVPAGAEFEMKDEIKSVITVVAKVNHYWQAHLEAQSSSSQ
jgi:hypothetical protein